MLVTFTVYELLIIERFREPEVAMFFEIAKPLLEDAKKGAEIMLRTGEIIRSVPFGAQRDSISVTTDRTLVRGTDSLSLGEKTFYIIGWKIE